MVTGVAGKHTKIEKTTASRESGFQLSRYLLWNVYHDYDFVWFCKDVEQVYLGKKVDKGKKKKEAEAFRCRRIIESISANQLSAEKYRIGTSNIMKVLDKYLERRTDT